MHRRSKPGYIVARAKLRTADQIIALALYPADEAGGDNGCGNIFCQYKWKWVVTGIPAKAVLIVVEETKP